MSGYLKQKLFQALHDLVGAGDLDQRLTHAGNYLVHLQEHEVSDEHRGARKIWRASPLSGLLLFAGQNSLIRRLR
jgi:hypothetical protein